jgi:hypothetical protein
MAQSRVELRPSARVRLRRSALLYLGLVVLPVAGALLLLRSRADGTGGGRGGGV